MNVNCPHCDAEIEIDPSYTKSFVQTCVSCGNEFNVQIGQGKTENRKVTDSLQNQPRDPIPKATPESKSSAIKPFIAGFIIGATTILFFGGDTESSANNPKATGKFLRLPNGKEIALRAPKGDIPKELLDQVKLKNVRWKEGPQGSLRVDGTAFNEGPLDLDPNYRLDLHIYLLDRSGNVVGKNASFLVRDGLRAKESASFSAYCDYAGSFGNVHSQKLFIGKAGRDFNYDFE